MKIENRTKMLSAVLSTALLLSACGAEAAEINTNDVVLEYDGINVQVAAYSEPSNENNISNDDVIKNSTDSANIHVETKREETEKNFSEKYESTTSYEINEWTFEDFISDLEVNDQRIILPCSFEELSALYEFDNNDNKCSYSEKLGGYSFHYVMDYKTKHKTALIGCHFLSQDENINNGKLIRFAVYSDSSGDYGYNFNCGGINNFSQMKKSDVVDILGEPNDPFPFESRYMFENNKEIIIAYDKNGYVNCIEFILGY